MASMDLFDYFTLPVDQWIKAGVEVLADNMRPFFKALRWPATQMLNLIEAGLLAMPSSVFLVILFLLVWQFVGLRVAAFGVLAMLGIGIIGAWEPAMTTLALVCTAVAFSVSVGFAIGILAARSDRANAWIRPVLDVMQTLPAFVYLVPVVMLMGIGNVPGVIVSIVFSLPPMIRLTSLGIREVPTTVVEAAYAFGSKPSQVLTKVQIPMAVPTIMAGVNQCIMMALAMATYSAMIAAGGLGEFVLRGIGRLDMGTAAIGGIGIVLLAMMLDRITQAVGLIRAQRLPWHSRGPAGFVVRLLARRGLSAPPAT